MWELLSDSLIKHNFHQYYQILGTLMYHVTDRMLLIHNSYPIAEIIIGTIVTSQLAGLSVNRFFQDFEKGMLPQLKICLICPNLIIACHRIKEQNQGIKGTTS